jgi:hypothetical protein
MDNGDKKGGECTPRSRCRNARGCEYCARVRQQQIGAVAEKLEQQHGQLTMTVLKPEQNTAKAVKALHASFMRRALAPAGLWTVEQGTLFGGLHLNILSPKPLPARWRGQCYSELLTMTARDAAAYISKREGMPEPVQYSGRLYGSWGKVGEVLMRQGGNAIVQAAAVELAMSGGVTMRQQMQGGIEYRTDEEEREGWTEGDPVDGARVWWSNRDPLKYTRKHPRPQLSKEERAEVMRRNLPNIYAALGKVKEAA